MALTEEQLATLTEAARTARARSYSPYSNFAVGCAALLGDGTVVTGANIENGSYPVGICAERATIATIFSQRAPDERDIVAVVVAGPDDVDNCAPCGGCRQWLHELAPNATIGFPWDGSTVTMPVSDLLPFGFDLD